MTRKLVLLALAAALSLGALMAAPRPAAAIIVCTPPDACGNVCCRLSSGQTICSDRPCFATN